MTTDQRCNCPEHGGWVGPWKCPAHGEVYPEHLTAPTSSLEEARKALRAAEQKWATYLATAQERSKIIATLDKATADLEAAARAEVIREVEAALTNQDGCDCDSEYEADRGFAPRDAVDHAGDCPVMERWDEFRARLRALSQGGEGNG